jgi:preprotein translocase subunit SecA
LFTQYKLRELIPVQVLSGNNIDNPIVRLEIDRLQRIIENQHLEVKKTLCKYSFLIEQQRNILFQKRSDILIGKQALDVYKSRSPKQFNRLLAHAGEEQMLRICQILSLANLDKAWSLHCAEINEIRDTIHLRTYGKQDPHFEYNKCAIELFDALLQKINDDALAAFDAISISNGQITLPHDTAKAPSATWTYLVNDNPFEDAFAMELIGNTGLSLWAGLLWPLTGLYFMAKKFKENKAANTDK